MPLIAAAAASRGEHIDALVALDRVSALAASTGKLSGGLPLRSPGLPATLWFLADGRGSAHLELARAQLRLLTGQPRVVVEEEPGSPFRQVLAFTTPAS